MNREIKFRAWDSELKFMVDPIAYIIRFDGMPFFDNKGDAIEQSEKLILMQYTGLKDKNGKEIYEGDIVDYGNNRYYKVIFHEGSYCMEPLKGMPWLIPMYKIIGNIYENPNLITCAPQS